MTLRLAFTAQGFVAASIPARKLASRHAGELVASEEWEWVAELVVSNCTDKGAAMLVEMGLLAGISSGAAVAAMLDVARKLTSGVVVTIFPDGAEKYLNESFWNVNDE